MAYLRNLGAVKAGFKIKAESVDKIVRQEVERAGRLGEAKAVSLAPVDLGKLKQSIHYEPTRRGFGARLTANVDYAAYQEFGTGGEVDIPEGFETLARKFKGKGERTINMPAQPYLIPGAKHAFQILVERLKQRI